MCNIFEDIPPYNKIIDGKWSLLEPSPTGCLIKERFDVWYNGKLSWMEIDLLKEKMLKAEKVLDEYKQKVQSNILYIKRSIYDQKWLCKENQVCLEDHLKICDSKCKKDFVCYTCKFKENGMCIHYYEIEDLEEKLEYIEYEIEKYTDRFIDLKINYEKFLMIKENRYEEYINQINEDFDDLN